MTNPEQSHPFVRLVPPHTYGLPINCSAYATTEEPEPDPLPDDELAEDPDDFELLFDAFELFEAFELLPEDFELPFDAFELFPEDFEPLFDVFAFPAEAEDFVDPDDFV